MIRIKRIGLKFLIALLIAGIIPASTSAFPCNEMTGLMITTTAGTLPEATFRIKGYTGFVMDQVLSVSVGTLLDAFVSNMGTSFIYGLSKNTEMCLNIQSFNNIIRDGRINIPEIHLNAKINLIPKYDSTGVGFVIQLVNYSNDTITPAADLYVMGTGVLKDAVELTIQAGLMDDDVRAAIAVPARKSTNFVIEMYYNPSSIIDDTLWLFPGVRIGSSESGFQLKLSAKIDVAKINLATTLIYISAGISF